MNNKNISKYRVTKFDYNKKIEGKEIELEKVMIETINKPRKPNGNKDPYVRRSELNEAIQASEKRIIKYVDKKIDQKIGELRIEMNQKFDEVNKKFDEVNQKFNELIELIKNK